MSRRRRTGVVLSVAILGIVVGRLLFALDEAEQIGLPAVEMGVFKVPWLGVAVAFQDALLEVGDLVEAIHVELPDERRKLLMLEPATEDFSSKAFMVKNYVPKHEIEVYVFSVKSRAKSG